MAESKFIRTVTYGGFDRNDVNKRLENLYSQLYELKNELRETKLTLEEYKKGTPEEKAHENVLAVERTKLTDELVQNEKLTGKLKTAEEDAKTKDNRIAELEAQNKALNSNVEELKKKLAAYEAGNDTAALSTVFIEAQKSASLIVDNARKEAEEKSADAKKLAEDTIAEANNTAAQIIFDAEKKAAEIAANAKNSAEEMKAASGNLRAVLMGDIEKLNAEVTKLKGIFDDFERNGRTSLDDSSKVLDGAYAKLTEGGVPVFKTPEKLSPEYPEAPVLEKVNTDYSQNVDKEALKKKNEELEKLQAMAASLSGGKTAKAAEKPKEEPKKAPQKAEEKKPAGGGIDLADLMKQAQALGGKK